MPGGHYVMVCQYGHTHGQCRCFSGNKTVKRVKCTTPSLHKPDEKYEPKHRAD